MATAAHPNLSVDEIRARLLANQARLREMGVVRISLFGSRARGDHRPDSDVDLLVKLDPVPGLFEYFDIVDELSALLEGSVVDLVMESAATVRMRRNIARDRVSLLG